MPASLIPPKCDWRKWRFERHRAICNHSYRARFGLHCPHRETVDLARYFFEVENGGLHRDETGAECRDLDEVRAIAVRTLTGIAAEEAIGDDLQTITVAVRDANGTSILDMTITLTTAWSIQAGE